jgi:hypothetical protein
MEESRGCACIICKGCSIGDLGDEDLGDLGDEDRGDFLDLGIIL